MKYTVPAAGVILFAWLGAASLQAHHSPSAIFDMSKHEAGKVEQWTFQSNPPSWYKSVGLARADFAKAIGQQISIQAVKARDGSLYGYMDRIKLPDGTSYELLNSADPK